MIMFYLFLTSTKLMKCIQKYEYVGVQQKHEKFYQTDFFLLL